MLKDVLSDGVLTHFAVIGLVIFVAVFLGAVAWILSRSKQEVAHWAHLPLAKDTDAPAQPLHDHAPRSKD